MKSNLAMESNLRNQNMQIKANDTKNFIQEGSADLMHEFN
jgi:hypothetical protein